MVKLATNVTDSVADFLTRIRNANISHKDELHVPASKMKRRPPRPILSRGNALVS